MNYKEIIATVMNKCNVDDDDTQGIDVIKLGINEAYFEVSQLEGNTLTMPLPIINGILTLPEDLFEIKKIEPELKSTDKIEGNRIFTEHKNSLTITYSSTPEELSEDTDVPEISNKFIKGLIHYGCFSYYQFKKKDKVAASYYNSYDRLIKKYTNYYTQSQISEVYKI